MLEGIDEVPQVERIGTPAALAAITRAEQAALALGADPDNRDLTPNINGVAEAYKLLSEQTKERQ